MELAYKLVQTHNEDKILNHNYQAKRTQQFGISDIKEGRGNGKIREEREVYFEEDHKNTEAEEK